MKPIRLELEEVDLSSLARLLGDDGSVTYGEWLPGPDGTRVFIEPRVETRSLGFGDSVVVILLSIPPGVASSLIANWLWSHLKRSTTLRMNRTEVEFTEGEITRVIREHIEREE